MQTTSIDQDSGSICLPWATGQFQNLRNNNELTVFLKNVCIYYDKNRAMAKVNVFKDENFDL